MSPHIGRVISFEGKSKNSMEWEHKDFEFYIESLLIEL